MNSLLNTSLPLFPLAAHILPGGRLPLRIFEPRYTRLVRQCSAAASPFVICMYQQYGSDIEVANIGTQVQIVDFNPLPDGLLGITVEASHCVMLNDFKQEADGLRFAKTTAIALWPKQPVTAAHRHIQAALQALQQEYPEIQQRYCQPQWRDLSWLAYRWLEHLPLEISVKQQLLQNANPAATIQLINQLMADPA